MTKPSVGRFVHFYPGKHSEGCPPSRGQPLAATIATVWSDSCVNLGYLDANGVAHNATSVPLIQDDDTCPDEFYCVWPPRV